MFHGCGAIKIPRYLWKDKGWSPGNSLTQLSSRDAPKINKQMPTAAKKRTQIFPSCRWISQCRLSTLWAKAQPYKGINANGCCRADWGHGCQGNSCALAWVSSTHIKSWVQQCTLESQHWREAGGSLGLTDQSVSLNQYPRVSERLPGLGV